MSQQKSGRFKQGPLKKWTEHYLQFHFMKNYNLGGGLSSNVWFMSKLILWSIFTFAIPYVRTSAFRILSLSEIVWPLIRKILM
jgi:hypothetical protein